MTALKLTFKLATTTSIGINGLPIEELKYVHQLTPLDGKVYRLLRPDEHAENGISAKSKLSMVSAADHVAWGSSIYKQDSKYISVCRTFGDALALSLGNKCLNGDIVSIDVDRAPVIVIHVYDENVRNELIVQENVVNLVTIWNFHTYAGAKNELLLVGDVPPDCVKIERRKQFLPNLYGNIAL